MSGGPTHLRVLGRVEPLCIETPPAFSWIPASDVQTGFHLRVGTSAGAADLWDTGEVDGRESVEVPYEGPPLGAGVRAHWQVRTRDVDGAWSPWSATASWTTGLTGGDAAWAGARWIAGALADPHDWTDLTVAVRFRGTWDDLRTGLAVLVRAEAVGKAWDEALRIAVEPGPVGVPGEGRFRLRVQALHGRGQTWVDDGVTEPRWGVDRHDPQSETNPVESGVRTVEIATVDLPEEAGVTLDSWAARDHELVVDAQGCELSTSVNGVEVDRRTLHGDEIRRRGTVGVARSTSAVVRHLRVVDRTGARPVIDRDLRRGANPFESGTGTAEGVRIGGKSAVLPPAAPAPLLRRAADLPEGPIARALLHLAVAGFAEVTVNGVPLTVDGEPPRGDLANVPRMLLDQTAYDRTVLYDAFDVTGSVRAGDRNVVAVELGRGWYGVTTPTEWYWHLAPYVGAPRIRARLRVEYEDGRVVDVVSDETWETASGPTTFDSVYAGEKHEARRAEALGAWRTGATADARDWSPASVVLEPGSCSGPAPRHHGRLPASTRPIGFAPARLRAAECPPVCVVDTLTPLTWSETSPGSGVHVADLGQIVTGTPVLTLAAIATGGDGWTVRLRGGNAVRGTGTTDDPLVVDEENLFHDAQLQVGELTVGQTAVAWEPRFCSWGFRYLEVRNLEPVLGRAPSRERDPDLLRVRVARTAFGRTGTFSSDNPLLGRIVRNLEWAQQNNNVGKPTDTPSREKNGWTGDTFADSEAQCIVWDLRSHLTKYLRGFPDGQISTGQLPMILPAAKGGYGYDRTPGWEACWQAVPAWDAAFFEMPWELWQRYGTTDLFAELYPHQDRLLRYYETLFRPEDGYRFSASLGAYSGAEPAGDNALISLQCYVHAADRMRDVGGLLGEREHADRYDALAGELRRALVAGWWDAGAGHYAGGSTSSAAALAVAWDLVPGSDLPGDHPLHLAGGPAQGENRAALVDLLARRIVEADHHVVNDMFGSRYELDLLSDHGHTDIALRAVLQPGPPGWVDQIARGATSLWELWSGGSLNHHYRSNVATWLHQSLAGIRPTAPAYASIRIRPCIPTVDVPCEVPTGPGHLDLERRPLRQVSSSIRTVRGEVASRWRVDDDGGVAMEVVVPANTRAEVWVPGAGDDGSVGARPYAVLEVEPGRHRFTGRI